MPTKKELEAQLKLVREQLQEQTVENDKLALEKMDLEEDLKKKKAQMAEELENDWKDALDEVKSQLENKWKPRAIEAEKKLKEGDPELKAQLEVAEQDLEKYHSELEQMELQNENLADEIRDLKEILDGGARNVHEAILGIKKDVGAIGKDEKGYGYDYRGIDTAYNRTHEAFLKWKVTMTPEVQAVEKSVGEIVSKKGKPQVWVLVTVKYTLHHAPSGTSTSVTMMGEGLHGEDKALNIALSKSHKYAIYQLLKAPTEGVFIDCESRTHVDHLNDVGSEGIGEWVTDFDVMDMPPGKRLLDIPLELNGKHYLDGIRKNGPTESWRDAADFVLTAKRRAIDEMEYKAKQKAQAQGKEKKPQGKPQGKPRKELKKYPHSEARLGALSGDQKAQAEKAAQTFDKMSFDVLTETIMNGGAPQDAPIREEFFKAWLGKHPKVEKMTKGALKDSADILNAYECIIPRKCVARATEIFQKIAHTLEHEGGK